MFLRQNKIDSEFLDPCFKLLFLWAKINALLYSARSMWNMYTHPSYPYAQTRDNSDMYYSFKFWHYME